MRKVLMSLVVLLALYGGLGAFLCRGKVLEARHQDYAEAEFAYSTGSFADYID